MDGDEGPIRKAYPCPFPSCNREYPRLADHLATKHKLGGSTNKIARHKLLDIAHKKELTAEDLQYVLAL